MERSIRSTLVVTTALFMVLGIGAADSADLTLLAEAGGFLLGNAYRCGVPTKRVDRAREVIHDLTKAAAYDSTEETAVHSRFAGIFGANAFPN